jgi:hypothetical protein
MNEMAFGKRRAAWGFKGKTPWWFMLTACLLIADTAAHFILSLTVSWWASPVRDAMHTNALPFRDGVVYFVSPAVSRYLGAWWISIVLFLALVVLLLANRDQLERTV